MTVLSTQQAHSLPLPWCVQLLLLGALAWIQPIRARAGEWPPTLRPFLATYCYECHDTDTAKADLDLEKLPANLAQEDRIRLWTEVHDRVAHGEMPPATADQPNLAERNQVVDLLDQLLTEADRSRRRIVLRRLNRVQYEQTVRDLFGIEVFVKDTLPEDASAEGFDNIGAVLSISTEQMQAYLDTADEVLDTVFGPKREPKRIDTTLNLRDLIDEKEGERTVRITESGVVLFNSGYNPSVLRKLDVPGAGLYRVRVQARAVQTDKPVTMLVYGGVWGQRDKHIAGYFDIPPGETRTVEFTDRLWERGDTFEFYPVDTVHRQTDPDHYDGPGLFVGDVQVQGPLEAWPPSSRARLLGGVDATTATLADAERVLTELLPRAFRRPCGADELHPVLALVQEALHAGRPFEQSLRTGLKSILCSPEFLFLDEPDTDRINDYALASRLSYFLWSSMPDQTLFALAQQGRLHELKTLDKEVERMLSHPKARQFTRDFTGQWLKLRDIDFTLPDQKLYPDYDELLKRSMVDESHHFFQEILDANLSLTNFLDSSFIFVNERLARHYGIPNVTGLSLRKVTLPPDSVRGGILTQAALLKVTANGTTTSPVTRGAWVLDNILGRRSPPPPQGVAALEPDIRGATTIREQLERHRNSQTCARCHAHIDPPGFALENFDVIGGWRDYYRTLGKGQWIERDPRYPNRYVGYRKGPAVDSETKLPDGRTITDIRNYRHALVEQKDEFARCLTEKLLTYALGRRLGYSDRPAVAAIVARTKEQDNGFRTLLHEIIRSELFQAP